VVPHGEPVGIFAWVDWVADQGVPFAVPEWGIQNDEWGMGDNPTFIANTAKHYLFIQEIGDRVGDYLARGKTGFRDLLNDYLTGKGTLEQDDWAWEELFAFVKTATQTPVRNPLLSTYWTMASVRHGDYIAKVRVAPSAENAENAIHHQLDLSSGPDVYTG